MAHGACSECGNAFEECTCTGLGALARRIVASFIKTETSGERWRALPRATRAETLAFLEEALAFRKASTLQSEQRSRTVEGLAAIIELAKTLSRDKSPEDDEEHIGSCASYDPD